MQLLLIDDHPIIHVALRTLFEGLTPPVTLHSAQSAPEARDQLARLPQLDMVLLDLELHHEHDGFALLQDIRQSHPVLPIVVLSASNEMAKVIRSIDLGAMGFIPKHSAPEEFKEALLLVITGGIYVPSRRVSDEPMMPPRRRAEDFMPEAARPTALASGWAAPPRSQVDQLPITPRQKDVLRALLQGKSNKVIASDLGIGPDTVKDHVATIFRVLGVSSRTQAVLAVAQWHE
jgi:DNA-binding NarL/FixJ family response regulator